MDSNPFAFQVRGLTYTCLSDVPYNNEIIVLLCPTSLKKTWDISIFKDVSDETQTTFVT